MYVDASVICAILLDEPDADDLFSRLSLGEDCFTSSLGAWEASVSLSRQKGIDPAITGAKVATLLATMNIRIVDVTQEIGVIALDAYRRFGKGRHPAALNFGDCFAYACARHHNVPLLFKGNDFSLTDIAVA